MAARPTPSEQINTKKRARSPPDDLSGSVLTARHTLSFDDRKEAVLRAMYNKRTEIFEVKIDRIRYVNDVFGKAHLVTVKEGALTLLGLHSPDSAADANEYIRQVMNNPMGNIFIDDANFTYEEWLLKRCEDNSSMKPWNNLVPRLVPFDVEGMKPAGQVDKWCTVISLFGSSGSGKSEALKAVAEEIIQQLPNHVVYLRLDWKSDIGSTDRNIKVSNKLLEEIDKHVKRKIEAEVDCGLPLPDPKKFALVVTLDEIGRVPESARGLVSISRQLNGDERTTVPPAVLTLRKVFGLVVILLAGTTGETIATSKSEQGGIVVTDPSMVHFCNLDTPHCKVNGISLTREEYRQALVRHHIKLTTHNPWLGGRLLKSRLRLALDNPRVVSIVAEITRLRYTKTPDTADVPAAIPDEHDPTDPLSRHEFDHWAPLLANRYCSLNGLSHFNPFSKNPCAYSQRQLVFLRAHYVWDHHATVEIDDLVKEVLTSVDTVSLRSNQANCLLELQQLGLLTFLDLVDVNEKQQQYKVSIPPSLPYIALAALDCTVNSWACVAMQSVGLRFAAAMEWKGCATVGDAVPGLHVAGGRCLRDRRIAAAGGELVRGWCAVEAPCALHGLCDDGTREARFWTERVLPLLKDHSVVMVVSGSGSPWDCFALLRLEDDGGALAEQNGLPHAPKSAASLLVAALRMNAAAEGTTEEVAGALRADVAPYEALLKRTGFACYGEVVLGAAVCTRQPAPERESERVLGVVYASPVERVFAEL